MSYSRVAAAHLTALREGSMPQDGLGHGYHWVYFINTGTAGNLAQWSKHLRSKHEVLSLVSSTKEKSKRKINMGTGGFWYIDQVHTASGWQNQDSSTDPIRGERFRHRVTGRGSSSAQGYLSGRVQNGLKALKVPAWHTKGFEL